MATGRRICFHPDKIINYYNFHDDIFSSPQYTRKKGAATGRSDCYPSSRLTASNLTPRLLLRQQNARIARDAVRAVRGV